MENGLCGANKPSLSHQGKKLLGQDKLKSRLDQGLKHTYSNNLDPGPSNQDTLNFNQKIASMPSQSI